MLRQPQGIARLASNSLTSRITYCVPFNGSDVEIVTGKQLTRGTGYAQGTDAQGLSLKSAGTAACASIPLSRLAGASKLSLSFWLYWDAFADNDALAFEYTANWNSNAGILIDPGSSATPGTFLVGCSSGTNVAAKHFTRPSAGAWHHYAINLDQNLLGGTGSIWLDGATPAGLAIEPTGNFTPAGTFSSDTLYILSRDNASLFGAGRLQNLVIRAGYAMTAAEALAEYTNPWQLYAAPRKQFYVALPAAGITGTAADTQARNTSAATGAVAIAGTGVDTQAKNTTAGAGKNLVSGTAADPQGKNTTSAAGANAISGTAADTQAPNVSSGSGAVSIDGAAGLTQQPNVSDGEATTDAANNGAGEYETKRKRRYVTKVNGQLVVIPDPSVLDLLHEEPEPVKVPVKEIKAKAKVYNLDKEMAALLKAEKYEQALKLHEELQDEEDIEMLLLAL